MDFVFLKYLAHLMLLDSDVVVRFLRGLVFWLRKAAPCTLVRFVVVNVSAVFSEGSWLCRRQHA